jgi:hypothetical protein
VASGNSEANVTPAEPAATPPAMAVNGSDIKPPLCCVSSQHEGNKKARQSEPDIEDLGSAMHIPGMFMTDFITLKSRLFHNTNTPPHGLPVRQLSNMQM